jgi:beta-fructofuranosidase
MRGSRRRFLELGAGALATSVFAPRLTCPQDAAASAPSREALAADPLRPQFHLLPARNWMNDPDGPIYWNGKHHMFFQYNPNAAVWGDMHWAHAVSPDMIHWEHLPVALAPTPGGYDADGCFTGSAVDDFGTPTFIYTGVTNASPERATLRDGRHTFREVQCLATSRDPLLRTWTKLPQPVLEPPDDPKLTGFRDPCLWRDEKTWYMGIGSGQKEVGGQVLLYRSSDLRRWEYLHPLASGHWTEKPNVNLVDSGEMWECPDFFPLAGKHVLFYSTEGKVVWEVGEFDLKELRFHSEKRGRLDYGTYYAPKSQLDAKENRILWGWIPESRPESEFSAAGWAGCMSLPRVLSIGGGKNEGLQQRFALEAQQLRGRTQFFREGLSPSRRGETLRSMEFRGPSLEIQFRAEPKAFAWELTGSKSSPAILSYDPKKSGAEWTLNGKSAPLPPSGKLFFHLFFDGSVVEAIANDSTALTVRTYDVRDESLRLRVSEDSLKAMLSLEVWEIQRISPDRLTS